VFHATAGTIPNDWHDFDLSPFKPAPPKISEAIGLLEAYFDAKRISDALPALQQLKSLIDVGDGHEVDRSHVMQEHMKWLEDPAHDLWLVPDGSSAQYFDLRKNDERFTGYGVLALQKEAQAGMPRSTLLFARSFISPQLSVWQRIHESARNMSSLDSHNAFAVNVLDRLISGLRAKIGTHVASNYYSHQLLCKEAWNDAKKFSKSSKASPTTQNDFIIADDVSKHLLPQLSKKFPQTVGNSSQAQQFLLSLFSSKSEGVSRTACCQAVECLRSATGISSQQKKGYEPNLNIFSDRLASHPERLKNIYFTWLFLLRALKKVEPKLLEYDFSCGSQEETGRTKSLVLQLLKHVQKDDAATQAFKMLRAERNLFHNDDERAKLIRIIRSNFHTISQNIDCIACDSCRLQAKVKITGLAFAVRIILNDDLLRETTYGRNDVIAFINTIQQFSKGRALPPTAERTVRFRVATCVWFCSCTHPPSSTCP
jgi:hypothetical protein